MGDILDGTADYDATRKLVPVTDSEFSDAEIEMFPFLPFVEILVKGAVTDWATLKVAAGDDWELVRTGTSCLLALKIAMTQQSGGKQSSGAGFAVGGYRETQGSVDWEAKKEELMTCASIAFGSISAQTRTALVLGVFSGPTSSGANVPDDWESYWEKILPRVVDFVEEGEDEDD